MAHSYSQEVTSLQGARFMNETQTLPASSSSQLRDQTYSARVNPQWVNLLNILDLNETYTRCQGSELHTAGGRTILDALSGYCVYNTGHNHPRIIAALKDEMDNLGPTMLQSHVPELAARLAQRLIQLAGGRLEKVFFTSSGSEGIEAVIKFARAHAGRTGILYARDAFHGLTCGALSLMGDSSWAQGFGPLLPDTVAVPFGDLEALREKLESEKFAALVLEPVQAEAGIRVPDPDYLTQARALCSRHGTLLVMDEVQTGLYRTGRFLASHHFGIEPDMVVVAKALSGGMVPVGAVLMTQDIYKSVFSSLSRAFIHASTFGENSLAMRAGLATLDVLEGEDLGSRATDLGERLRTALTHRLASFEMVEDVRGLGLLNGIAFRAPQSLRLKALYHGFSRVHPGMFGQMLVSRMFTSHNILTQMCGNNYMVIKVAPPLVVSQEQLSGLVESVASLVQTIHSGFSFWREGLAMLPRAVRI